MFGKGERMFDFPCLHNKHDDEESESELEKYKRKHSLIDAKQMQMESCSNGKRKQSLIDADHEEQALKDANH